ncbi:MAG: von Willebrand factor type [Firmicutes bacterium]|nr:von Willebrand factor type [Bacillota bacterium]
MKSIIYTAWDGKQTPFSLARNDIVKTFIDNIMEGMSPNMSLAQMLWEGFPLSGMDFQVMGLREMLQKLQEQRDELFSQFSLEKIFDNPINDLQHLLEKEALTRQQNEQKPSPSFEDLSPGLLEKIASLEKFLFADEESKELFEHWNSRMQDILDLMDFYSQWGEQFKGKQYLDFDEALELMKRFKALEETMQQIAAGKWRAVDLETLKEMLGDDAAQSFTILLQVPDELSKQGLVQFGKEGFDLTPRGIQTIGEMAFGDLFHMVKRDRGGRYQGNGIESGEIEPDTSRQYRYGDRFDLDITKTILNAVKRKPFSEKRLQLTQEDFYVREREFLITSTTVMLLDLSWSMSWERRFKAAKKVALALDHYIRTKFPKDKFHVVGFSTYARELQAKELALAVWDMGHAFTNLQAGIRTAMDLIKRDGARNNRVIVLTDGQPTAYFEGDQLHVEFPTSMYGISPKACKATLHEVKRATAEGIQIDTFMLDSNPALVEFIREISRINGGRAVICLPDEIGQLILLEEIKRREQKY